MTDGYRVRFRLADVAIDAKLNFEKTVRFLGAYLEEAAGEADLCVEVTEKDLAKERQRSEKPFSDEYLETLALYRKIAEEIPRFGIVLMHGSALSMEGEGYLFTAKSGTGKSTHARRWREAFGERVAMINDDKPLLRATEDGIIVYGTPWDGKHRLSANTGVRLKAIAYLTRAKDNRIEPVGKDEMLPILLQQIYRPETPKALGFTMKVIEMITENVDFYHLFANMDEEAARVAYAGMKGE